MQAEFGFFYTNERARIRVTQYGEKTKIAESAVGKSSCRNSKPAFMEKHLHGPTLYLDIKIIYSFIKHIKCVNKLSF